MKPVFASLFSGFGLADIGAKQAGCDLSWAIEIDPQIAEVSRQLNHTVHYQSVTETNFSKLEKPDILWASPPCINFSAAKVGGKETGIDLELAIAIIEAVKTFEPTYFFLENVEAYKRSKSLAMIENTLFSLGYWCDRQVLNSADLGAPQTRRRLILRAVKGAFIPHLPSAVPWVGWYEAIADLIPELPETELANWQIERLPDWLDVHDSVVIESNNTIRDCTVRLKDECFPTVKATMMRRPVTVPKAILIDGQNARSPQKGGLNYRVKTNPSFSQSASASDRRAWLNQNRIVAMTPRALARFQTLPDWYELPSSKQLACKGIGNGVPCLMVQEIIKATVLRCDGSKNSEV